MKTKKIIVLFILMTFNTISYSQSKETYIGKTVDGKSEYYLIDDSIKYSDYNNEVYA